MLNRIFLVLTCHIWIFQYIRLSWYVINCSTSHTTYKITNAWKEGQLLMNWVKQEQHKCNFGWNVLLLLKEKMNLNIFLLQILFVSQTSCYQIPPARFFIDVAAAHDKDHLVFHYPIIANQNFIRWHKFYR